MKRINNIIGKALLMLTLPLAISGCADEWDNHYEAVTHGDGTLWQTISANSEISNFQKVLEACGLKTTLDGSQVCTVFAPTNSCFTAAMADSIIELYQTEKAKGIKNARNAAIKEFVRNHVALYNYSVSSLTNDTIQMMNGKYLSLSSGQFAQTTIQSKNLLTNNGLLFIVDQVAAYHPNVYECIGREAGIDSVGKYIYQYSVDVFSPSQSVPGDIIDGKTHYLDSVTYLENDLLTNVLEAEIENEDSTFWVLAPSNRVWNELLEEYNQYYQYDATIKGRDSLMYAYPRHAIVKGTIFSKTINPDESIYDSIMSTNAYPFSYRKMAWGSSDLKYYQFDKPFAEGGIFNGTEKVECSNGAVFKSDNWNVDKHNTFMRNIAMEGANTITIDSVYTSCTVYPTGKMVAQSSPDYDRVFNHCYIEVAPTGSLNIKALFAITNLLSNLPYDIYVVTLPRNGAGFKFRCALQCNDTLGNAVWVKPDDFGYTPLPIKTTATAVDSKALFSANTKASKQTAFLTSREDIDSVYVGTFTFPTCSYNTSKPQVKLYLEGRASSSDEKAGTYSKTLLMDCILARPCLGEDCPHHGRMSK